MDNTCATCRAFYNNETFGQCRLHPQMVPKRPDEWCLDWQVKGTPRSKALPPTTDEFDRFWAEYPRRIGKKAAQKAFQNAQDRPRIDDLLEAIRKAKRSPQWLKENGQFIPHPATWLNRGQWADVPPETKPSVFEEFLARGEHDDESTGICCEE